MQFTIVASVVSGDEPSLHCTGLAGGARSVGCSGHIVGTQGISQCTGVAGDGVSLILCVDQCNRTCAAETVVPLVAAFGSPIPATQALAVVQPAEAVGLT